MLMLAITQHKVWMSPAKINITHNQNFSSNCESLEPAAGASRCDPASRKSQQLPNKHQINQWQKYQTTSPPVATIIAAFVGNILQEGSNLSKGIRCVYSLAIMALMPDHLTLDDTYSASRPTLVISQSINPIFNSCWHPAPAQTGG